MIRSLRLVNFKNFADATLTLGPVTVLVGANGSGKSNVRDALRVIYGIGMELSFADLCAGNPRHGWEGIRGGAEGLAGDPSRPVYIGSAEEFNGSSIFAWCRVHDGDWIVERDCPEAFAGRDAANLDTFFSPLDKELNLPFLDCRFFDLQPEVLRAPCGVGQNQLGPRGENLSGVLHHLMQDPASKELLLAWIGQLLPTEITDLKFPKYSGSRIQLAIVEEYNKREVDADALSDGTLRFLGLLASLLTAEPGDLLFFEEIENGIHPARLHLLMELIESEATHRGLQVVLTTHSPTLLGNLSEEMHPFAQLIYRDADTRGGRIGRIMDLPNAAEIVERNGLGRLHATNWIDNMFAFKNAAERNPQP